jgi:hypothetical protein
MGNIEDCDNIKLLLNEERVEYFENKFSIIYDRFIKDIEALQEEAGGADKLTVGLYYGTTIYHLGFGLSE